MNYADEYEFESERLSEEEYNLYKNTTIAISPITEQCMWLLKSDLDENSSHFSTYGVGESFSYKEIYLNYLTKKLKDSLSILEKLSVKPNKPNRFQTTLRNIQELKRSWEK